MKILAIESSCDETAVAIVEDGKKVLSNVVFTQIDIHTKYGGVVPEIASRHHIEKITYVIDQAMKEANLLKAFEVLAGRVLELENEIKISEYRMEKLKEIVDRAEREAAQ